MLNRKPIYEHINFRIYNLYKGKAECLKEHKKKKQGAGGGLTAVA